MSTFNFQNNNITAGRYVIGDTGRAMTVQDLLDKIKVGIAIGLINPHHKILVGGGENDTFYVENIVLPAVKLEEKDYKSIQILFT